jgi:F0F1-type ATP synthase assembly protein I
MQHPYAKSRALARRMVLYPLGIVLIASLLALTLGGMQSVGVLYGGVIAVSGSVVFALLQFGGRLVTPERMVRQFFVAGACRWLVFGLGWVLGIALWKFPFLPMLTGFVAAQLASIWVSLKS